MRIAMHVCPTKFLYVRQKLSSKSPRILDIGCGNNSPSTTKHWFPGCHYSGADIAQYNNNEQDLAAIDDFYPLGLDGSGYSVIPDKSYDFIILHHVIEHMETPAPILATICSKLKPGGYIWIAFPSLRSLSLPSAEGSLQFCDDPTHVHVPEVREISNILLANDVKVLNAGRSKDFVRTLIGAAILPLAFLRRLFTGRMSAKGLWYVLGFEDHVFGQRRAN
ncbi:MAG TPA: methyltransferase domain-containing protein [Edaphobacter sp.]|nr:methyltransferase domain-containing protein [Edaphobacter sp.]